MSSNRFSSLRLEKTKKLIILIMKVLFVVADIYFSEPLGVMILSAISKKAGYQPVWQ
jgi:hypothetical protein